MRILLLILFFLITVSGFSQRKLPSKSREQKKIERQQNKQVKKGTTTTTGEDVAWNTRKLPEKSRGVSEISTGYTGTAKIIPSDAAEISFFDPSHIGFTAKTELLFRIGEEFLLPNAGIKHRWWGNNRFMVSTEHWLYYTYPLLKILQASGFEDLVPDSVKINHGFAMRHELLFSWLINPHEFGCPGGSAEKILSFRLGTEFYIGSNKGGVQPFNYIHSLYHTQLLDKKVLYYGGVQFDSHFLGRFRYSANALYYNVDMKNDYAFEANLRLSYQVSRRFSVSAACKGAYINIGDKTKFAYLPLLDVTYFINPGRGTIQHGLFQKRGRRLR